MKVILNLLIQLLLISNSFGQIDFEADAPSMIKPSALSYRLDSTFSLDKSYDFEFRLWTSPSLTDYTNVFILALKNNVWSAKFYEYNPYQKAVFTETILRQSKIDKLWERLVENHILVLPPHDSLRSRMKIFIADTSGVLEEDGMYKKVLMTDGTRYQFELSKKDKKRSYYYHCPGSYLKHYPNIEELYQAYSIIILIRHFIGLTLDEC
ncbi:MAG TPA: hypothetical protein VK484_00735 [Ferruginibacter sp.]|nr:hypothetical protein [Ferruginibacter sp.]